jgi:dihydroneopterin aldolase
MDEIMLRGLVFFGRHGVNPEETELGQRFGVDVTVRLDLVQAARNDQLEDTVSYSALYKLVRTEIEGHPSRLLEHLAGRLLDAVFAYDARIKEVEVTVAKLHPPLKGITAGDVAVRLVRTRLS